jgi:micrococcal nuclease
MIERIGGWNAANAPNLRAALRPTPRAVDDPEVRRRLALLPLLLFVLALAPAAAAAPPLHTWTGKVTFVADGDTIDVDIDGDGTRVARHVRLTGINANEISRYSKYPERRRGACHAVAATARVENLIRRAHWRVRLAAQDPRSHSGHRLRRQVSVWLDGRWVDVDRVLVAEGYALWLPNPIERAFNDDYRRLSLRAAAQHLRIWNPHACGPVPAPGARLSLALNWDADGADGDNPNGEWVRVRNDGPEPVALDGWWVRDSTLRRFTFPGGTTLAPGDGRTVYVGPGEAGGDAFHWGLREPTFENAGDGAYLFDRRGNLRAAEVYPRS